MRLGAEVTAALRPRLRYADPTGEYVATYASPLRRAGAAAIDWGLCYALFIFASMPLGMIQSVGRVSWEEGDLGGRPGHAVVIATQILTVAPIVAYWALLLPTSQTYGMRGAGLRMVGGRTGRGLSRLRALARGALATLFGIAAYAVFLDATAFDKGDQLDDRAQLMLEGCYVVFAVACLSGLLMTFSPTRRSLVDRIFGTAVLDELEAVVSRRPGPWGPLDAFDTSR